MTAPTITILIPVYNAEQTLSASLASALDQTRPADEILAINDGSRDGSGAILAAGNDPRLRVFDQDNQGLAATLNRGIGLATSTFIARLDNDDLALPERLERQLAFMEANPQVALLGTWAEIYVGDDKSGRFHRHPVESNSLKLDLLFDNPFVHSSVMYRTEVARAMGGYRVERSKRIPEDYEFWSRIARSHDIANLAEVHTVYREVPGSMMRSGAEEMLDNVIAISADNLQHVLPDVPLPTCLDLSRLYHGRVPASGRIALQAVALWRRAAIAVGGAPRQWTPEFASRYRLAQRRLLVQSVRRALPRPVAEVLRKTRRVLRTKI
ncbi:Glycosyl transferase family 2 [Devosia sp. YR412]|uniref:glycosyltransferase family 2 protein n=1 Tax=Devosia sp. YR412 TaxID=1881030 RepID=UPI0008B6C746|nr:glycosyltransferase [Devosia sp. YR412]SEQ32109.1 Glycosyl transferase family 2 [Devosia sp. YR412]